MTMAEQDANIIPDGGNVELDKDLSDKLVESGVDEDTIKSIQTLSAQRGHFKTKFEKEEVARQALETEKVRLAKENEELNEELKAKIPAPTPAPSPKPNDGSDKTSVSDARLSRLEFLTLHKDKVDIEDLTDLEAVAKGFGKTLEETLETDAWKAIASARSAKRATAASALPANNASPKDEKKVELTDEERAMAQKLGISEESMKRSKIKNSAR